MITRDIKIINRLSEEVNKATKTVIKNKFLIDSYLSLLDVKLGNVKNYKSAEDLFKKLKI